MINQEKSKLPLDVWKRLYSPISQTLFNDLRIIHGNDVWEEVAVIEACDYQLYLAGTK